MNKQKRTFVILAIVLAACLAGYLGLLNYNKYKSDDDAESESDCVEALSLDSSDVNSLSFLIDGREYTFSRIKSDGTSDETESTESEKTDTESEPSDSDDDEQWVCNNDTSLKSIQARSHHCLETPQALQHQRNLIQMRIHLILGWMNHRMS